jgi:hypothetical protein
MFGIIAAITTGSLIFSELPVTYFTDISDVHVTNTITQDGIGWKPLDGLRIYGIPGTTNTIQTVVFSLKRVHSIKVNHRADTLTVEFEQETWQ